jgi:hypothetical protein
MARRNFLRFAFCVAAGAAVFTSTVEAAPLAPRSIGDVARTPQGIPDAHPAVTSSAEVAQLKPEQVHWHGHWHRHGGWHRHWGWHHRRWGWHHRHWGWRHRHWGWHHGWHHRHWRHW